MHLDLYTGIHNTNILRNNCIIVRERESVCVCVSERVCVSVRECVGVCVCESVCVCVCQ